MKWLFYLVSLASVVLSGTTLAMSVSDIQVIIVVQFASLAILSFGLGKVLAVLGKRDRDDSYASTTGQDGTAARPALFYCDTPGNRGCGSCRPATVGVRNRLPSRISATVSSCIRGYSMPMMFSVPTSPMNRSKLRA